MGILVHNFKGVLCKVSESSWKALGGVVIALDPTASLKNSGAAQDQRLGHFSPKILSSLLPLPFFTLGYIVTETPDSNPNPTVFPNKLCQET